MRKCNYNFKNRNMKTYKILATSLVAFGLFFSTATFAQTKEKTLKKLEKSVDFFVGICYYNTRLERQGKTY